MCGTVAIDSAVATKNFRVCVPTVNAALASALAVAEAVTRTHTVWLLLTVPEAPVKDMPQPME